MNISIIIPNYNGEVLLRKNLPKLFTELNNYKEYISEVIVVDDASTDTSTSYLEEAEKEFNNLKFVVNKNNLGFSSTVNKGVNQSSGEIIILLNTDVYPKKDFLKPLIKHFQDKKVFAVGCLDKSVEGEKNVLRGRGLGEWKKGFLVHRRGEIDKNNTLWVSGGSGVFRRSIWEELGGFNELYNPFYWEDIDLSYRALKSGYKVLFEPKSVVIHEHEKGAIRSKYTPNQIKTISYRNQFIFTWENASDYSLKFQHLIFLPYHMLKALLRKDLAFFMGFFKALILLPEVIKSSFTYQRSYVLKDSEVISNYLE
jgi:GT2 family glycosyltransferase